MFGLDEKTLADIRSVLAKIKKIDKVIIYGSRAKGNYRPGSDIDITLIGDGLSLTDDVYPLMDELEELYLPYTFDISIYDQLENQNFIDHINSVGQVFYQKYEH